MNKILIFILLSFFSTCLSKQVLVYDENRILSAQQLNYFESLANELQQKTSISISLILVDDGSKKNVNRNNCGNDSILIYVAFKQQQYFVKIGENIKSLISNTEILEIERDEMIPLFRKSKYGQGILTLSYAIANKIAQQKNISITITPLKSEDESMTISGWIFIILIFGSLLFIAYSNRKKRFLKKSNNKFNGSFYSQGNFCGW